jgi:hypothetical protein
MGDSIASNSKRQRGAIVHTHMPVFHNLSDQAGAIGSMRLGSLFLTLPTRALTGQQIISSALLSLAHEALQRWSINGSNSSSVRTKEFIRPVEIPARSFFATTVSTRLPLTDCGHLGAGARDELLS